MQVNNFYEYWVNFESWRDFSLEGEHDLEDAHDRYEKRWMIKENERKAKVWCGIYASRRLTGWRKLAKTNVLFTCHRAFLFAGCGGPGGGTDFTGVTF